MRTWAHALIDLHLDPSWSFAFDNARTRAGLCNYTAKRISVSRHMALRSDDDGSWGVYEGDRRLVDEKKNLSTKEKISRGFNAK